MKTLFATITGSKLYGTSTPQSDTDFKGIAFGEIDEIVGLKNFEQQEFKDTINEDGPDKVEGTIWDFRKYIRLCLKGNPTVIEVAFADPKFHLFSTPIGLEIMEFVRKNMLTKHLFKPYSAYHRAQIRKMQSMDRKGKRKDIVDEHGYDIKFAMHAFRLSRQCVIVMEEGTLRPTLDEQDKDLALKIRKGKDCFTKDQVIEILEDVDKQMYVAYKKSQLPEKPDFNKANEFVVRIYKKYLSGDYYHQLSKEFNPNGI